MMVSHGVEVFMFDTNVVMTSRQIVRKGNPYNL